MKRKEEREEERKMEQSSGSSKFTFQEWAKIKHTRLYIARGARIKSKLSSDVLVSEKTFDEAINAYQRQSVRN